MAGHRLHPGPSLQYAVAEHGPLPVEATLRLVARVAEALQSIHAAGVIHRDLKPSNVILTAEGPKVIDFGIARAADVTSITGTGIGPGTPAYMAPEHIDGQDADPRGRHLRPRLSRALRRHRRAGLRRRSGTVVIHRIWS